MKMNKTTQLFIKFGKKIDKALGILELILIGIVLGYAWCWYALN